MKFKQTQSPFSWWDIGLWLEGGQRKKPLRWGPDLAALRDSGHSRRVCAQPCTPRTLSEVPRPIGGAQRVTGNDTPKCLCYMTCVLQSQSKILLLKAGKKSGFFTTLSILFLKGMQRKTALHQMSSTSSCEEFNKRRKMYEPEESAGKVVPNTQAAKAPFSDGSRQPPLAFTLGFYLLPLH